ncbi:hypothetical protein ACB092_09G104800 [Castanea dentata]
MQAEKQKSWKIYIYAKAKSFHFKLKATSIIPTWEFHHCSIVLKLGKCFLRLKSEYGTSINPKQPQCKTLRSKFIGFLKKYRFRRSKNRAIGFTHKSDLPHPEARFRKYLLELLACKELICMGSLVVGIFACLSQTICKKDWWGITIHGCVIILHLIMLFKKYMTGKISNFCLLLMGTSVFCSLAFDLDKYLKIGYVQRPWNYFFSSSLPGIFQGFIKLWGSR